MNKPHRLLLAALLLPAAILMAAMGSQDPVKEERRTALRFSELQFVAPNGNLRSVFADQLVEVRVHRFPEGQIQLELFYDNRDYSLVNVSGFELIRRGTRSTEVNMVTDAELIFPNLP